MTSHDAELSRNMDRITQLQDGIDNLVTIMYSTLSFLSRKADFKQLNPDIPITQAIGPEGTQPTPESLTQNCEELVQDFLRKAKQIEYLISILPPHDNHSNPTNLDTHLPSNTAQNSSSSEPQATQKPKSTTATSPTPQPPNPNRAELETENQTSKTETDEPAKPFEAGDEDDGDALEFERLQADVNAAQEEYDRALLEADSLHKEIKTALAQILDHRVELLSQLT
ncbi:hypothetical protein PTTG_04651 [Puccinia triticina 1-1 BBBD Race 1]|uniref:Mediator of RNA polymerase II transcription subunit 21 n=2 Tax=Puccinia triticina TaxID=208348 RepID=A0A180GC29_PUCT1|nr:uncharacterized protein PtA15_6A866 [Puccinia triticina]OAV90247.1 hypothetical protein PTTG_04651 [Puccinia triticina 1-1 BBBD Race 1]WAQ86234.1 hypothetical protein PtA15_6A866 [Puccinia triticina]WAR56120.1 hypothetical protein PtB15_6B865 [Puccinia triticina]